MKALRILILTNRVPYPLHDGGAMAMDALIQGYHNAGMKVRVLSMNTTRHFVPQSVLESLYKDIEGFDAVRVNNDVKHIRLLQNLFFSRDPEHVQRFNHPAFAEKLKDILQDFQPDVVQLESLFLSTYLPLITKARLVLRVHNLEYQIWARQASEEKGFKKRYLNILAKRMRRYEERIWSNYNLLLPITEVDAGIIHQAHPAQRLLVAPYGIETAPNHYSEGAHFDKAYHIGAMDWMPNAAAVDWLLKDIWPAIRAENAAAEFHFAGRNMPDRFFAHLPEGAFCHGEVANVEQFYADKHILLVPLRAGGGIRIKILEAMAAGKLVISTAIGMQGIDAIKGIHYLEANSPEEFAEAFSRVNKHPQEALKLIRQAARLIKEQYSNDTIIRNILEVLG